MKTKKDKAITAILASVLFISLATNFHYSNQIESLREELNKAYEQVNELDYQFRICKFLLSKRCE